MKRWEVYHDGVLRETTKVTGMTNEEVLAFLARNEWNSGIKANNPELDHRDWTLHYDDPEANAILLKYPATPGEVTYFSRLASLLGAEEESMFYGALLWITLSSIGSPQLEKTGWEMVDMMRRGFGENRPLEAAPGHWFRNGAVVELAAFILPCFVFGWDAYLVPSGGDLFVHISHDEYWAVMTRNAETYKTVLNDLKDLQPEVANQHLLQRFCPHSRHLKLPE